VLNELPFAKYQEIIAIAEEPLSRLFRSEATGIVKRTRCKGAVCPKLCRSARQDMSWIIKLRWHEYARWN